MHNVMYVAALFTSLHFTVINFILYNFIFNDFHPTIILALFITFLTLFLKLLCLQERVPKASSGH
jgi:archaellum biogenesis protein FlaJ (TadC family)